MLEGLVAWVLNNYLGKYVENLNTDQLSVALLSGKVELENLPLKKDALRGLGLPVEVVAGFVGRVQLHVPVRQLRTAPWLLHMERLYLVARPLQLDEWDAEREAAWAHERKMAVLQALEARWRARQEAAETYYSASYSSWLSYGTGLLAGILENLQLQLTDVHIRYEDAVTGERPFACGLTVGSLAGAGAAAGPGEANAFKLFELQQLALYWDPLPAPAPHYYHTCTNAELTERMGSAWTREHRYLVQPCGCSARGRRDHAPGPLRARDRPRLAATLTLPTVALALSKRQYGEMVGCARGLERLSQLREYRSLRPAAPVAAHARRYWLYALRCHCHAYRWTEPRPTWQSCAEAARATVAYVAAVQYQLTHPAAALPAHMQRHKDDYEWRTSLALLTALREVAMRRAEVPKSSAPSTPEQPRAGRSVLVHWFPAWWGWYGGGGVGGVGGEGRAETPPLDEELLDVLADSLEDDAMLTRDALFAQFEFLLTSGCLRITDDDDDRHTDTQSEPGSGEDAWSGVEVSFGEVRCGVEWRPRGGALALRVSLGTLSVRERLTRGSLFPVLAAPHGLVRAGLAKLGARALHDPPAPAAPRHAAAANEPLFQLTYEKKPYGLNCDYKLWVKSASLEVVWSAAAARWAVRWARAPFTGRAEAGGGRARRIISQLGHMMRGERRAWHVELDICAPQILLVEDLCDRDAAVMVVDFGRMRLANAAPLQPAPADQREGEEEEEAFMTPCSTPPGSPQSPAAAAEFSAPHAACAALDAGTLHDRIYDRYRIELSELQILVGRARDNWKYAHTKASSPLHLLDRFSIQLQARRRAVATSDPLYPAAAVSGSLPALVAHLSEHKLRAVRAVLTGDNARSWYSEEVEEEGGCEGEERQPPEQEDVSEREGPHASASAALFVLQFAIEHMSIEVQSLGRSIAEVQVGGARAALTVRAGERSLALSVHSLLLADALQTYGPDFELLVASHKHVGMDTASGSIRGSEPTSPTSPASPSECAAASHAHLHRLTAALHSLHATTDAAALMEQKPPADGGGGSVWGSALDALGPGWDTAGWGAGAAGVVDCEALIAVELTFVQGEGDSEDLRIANILFNNLDVIANQETIVELIGFAQRVWSPCPARPAAPPEPRVAGDHVDGGGMQRARETRTEITFDFHRLGVLLLRAAVLDGALVARKIATATLSEANIHATIAPARVEVGGSLGGVQVVSLCEGAGLHTRVVSAGRDPPAPAHTPLLPATHVATATDDRALLFSIERTVDATNDDKAPAVRCCVRVHVASVWYTHSGALLHELQSCLTEFTQYLANLARSIRAAAADMAIGLVHPHHLYTRGDSLSANPRQCTEGASPRRRTASAGCSLDDPDECTSPNVYLSVSVELESPVVVLPRAADSAHVLVAHLGRMSLSNRPGGGAAQRYVVRVRDISLAATDVSQRLHQYALCGENMGRIYCAEGARILHETALQLHVTYTPPRADAAFPAGQCEVSGSVVGGLHVSAARDQYDQVLETARWVLDAAPPPAPPPPAARPTHPPPMEGAVTLQLDPQLRASVLAVPPPSADRARAAAVPLKVLFSLGTLAVELRADLGASGGGGERSLVQLTFEQLTVRYHRAAHHTTLQVSLHSLAMEDLTQPPQSPHRLLMVSHTPPVPPKAVFVSTSCGDLTRSAPPPYPSVGGGRARSRSLPARLTATHTPTLHRTKQDSGCGATAPPPTTPAAEGQEEEEEWGPADDNLVWVHVDTRHADHPRLHHELNNVRKLTRVEFNCLNLVVSMDSWVAVLDFFGVTSDDSPPPASPPPPPSPTHHATLTACETAEAGVTRTEVSVRMLSAVVMRRGGGELCRALVSRARVCARGGAGGGRRVHGRLGRLLLCDLTPRSPLWRDRFRTHGDRALTFHYHRLSAAQAAAAGHETSLQLCVGPATYVHTKRFVHELQAFARDFTLLRAVIAQARLKVSTAGAREAARGAVRMELRVRCTAPVIVLPVSGRTRGALAAELHTLHVDNCFRREPHPGGGGGADTLAPTDDGVSLLDVRTVQLEGLTVYAARGGRGGAVRRVGAPLLPQPARLALTIETNLSVTRHVPDVTVSGALSTLSVALDPAQYRLVRGVLAHNVGEPVDDLAEPAPPHAPHAHRVWTTLSVKLSLQDVSVRLEPVHGVTSLACINFIKSRLLVETYSDLSQDIDLVSQEILVSDTRFAREPANRRGNVFSHIVQPLPDARHTVQAEVHARKRADSSAYTILVNNMRLMCVLDWWECANQFIMQPPPPPHDADHPPLDDVSSSHPCARPAAAPAPAQHSGQVELKLNVTDSQLVLVEDASLWDTNAVILKSTTVITYRPWDLSRPVVCEVNELEVFSCVLGLEEDTALPILEPAALTATVRPDRALQVEMGTVNVRLSYHDMLMFAAMARSLPAQARAAAAGGGAAGGGGSSSAPPANQPRPAHFHAPLWGRAQPAARQQEAGSALWPLRALEVTAECVTLCVIDDCLDSDVPLLEVSLSELRLQQDLRKPEEAFEDPVLVQTPAGGAPVPSAEEGRRTGPGGGRLAALLTADYYNRTLSGWEPVVEPWRFGSTWEYSVSERMRAGGRVQVAVSARGVLDLNLTSPLVALAQLVRTNWTKDYYAPQTCCMDASAAGASAEGGAGSPAGPRRRSPFVPYALRNHTGHKLWFTTVLTTCDRLEESTTVGVMPDDSWVAVRANDTEPFSFGARRGAAGRGAGGRGGAPHPLHRLAIRLERWAACEPVCVDRVGTFWREVVHAESGARARLVLHVQLEGSARKLVTVRSALRLRNRLPHPVEVRVDAHSTPGVWMCVGADAAQRVRQCSAEVGRARAAGRPPSLAAALHPLALNCGQWSGGGGRMAAVDAGETWAAPLGAAGALWTRPLVRGALPYAACPLEWGAAPVLLHAECRAPPDTAYRFSCSVTRDPFPDAVSPLPGHTLTLLPALRLTNLLPVELTARAVTQDEGVRAPVALAPAAEHPFTDLNLQEGVELSVKLEGFGWSSPLSVGGAGTGGSGHAFSARLKLRDTRGRRLYLSARVSGGGGGAEGACVTVSAAYWIVNRTHLPLVFRAEGAAAEAAGQFEEHEVARMVAPLVFSFAEAEGGPTLQARLGRADGGRDGEWSAAFGLGAGGVRRLEVRGDGRTYLLGVSTRAGRGRHRHTSIVTLAPRHQLHNNTPHVVQFAQRCMASTVRDPGALGSLTVAPPGSCLPWHWPRADREPLLCVRLLAGAHADAAPLTAWSGGFRIHTARTLHVACRETRAGCAHTLLRVEVAPAGCSLLCVLSADDAAPPPLRLDNYSPVAIMFHQVGCGEESVVGAHGALCWALPEPEGAPVLALRAPGGPKAMLPLDALPQAVQLLYQNFIYIAFTHTSSTLGDAADSVLVLEVPQGATRVVLARRRHGDRAQLWRRGPQGQLVHEGSGPPTGAGAAPDDTAPLPPAALVLDIEDSAPRPPHPAPLALRRADPRRQSTQAWRMRDGRMGCAHANLCVQPEGGLMGLVAGRRAVLAMPARLATPPPPEQAVGWHTLRPGSGRLDVSLLADGPTRVLQVRDHAAPDSGWIESAGEERAPEGTETCREWGVRVTLGGVGVSVVGGAPSSELVYARLTGVALDVSRGRVTRGALAVHAMQWDNQLPCTLSPVLVYALGAADDGPVVTACVEMAAAPRRYRAVYLSHVMVALRPLAVRLEERLMLQLWAWAAPGDAAAESVDDADADARTLLTEITSDHATRCYVALIKLMPSQIRLSMATASKLEEELGALKRRLGLTLVRFEDAAVELEPFVRAHAYDTPAALARHAAQHFKDELKWQAAKILGSVDLLGAPLGFVADVSEGVSGLLLEGNVGALVASVAHGLSNSAAKVSSSLGDGLERVVADEAHEETRRRIRQGAGGAGGGAHLAAGLRGLGLGLLGGVTSLVKHSYEGAAADGLGGFLAGVGKGLVGTVTKPVIGVLDLAAEAASALRDTSQRGGRGAPERVRAPRCAAAAGSLLPRYCPQQAAGARALLALNGGDPREQLVAYGAVRGAPHDIRALLSTTYLRIFTARHHAPQLVMETHLSNLVSCARVETADAHYVELSVRGGGAEGVRRPRVQCDSAEGAAWLARHALYARQLHREHKHTLPPH